MLARLSQVARHLGAPASSTPTRPLARSVNMASASAAATERGRRKIQTAACLIIGDEVLGGKTVDTNSTYMARWCFSLGLRLKKVEVVEDEESDIIEAVRRMSSNYDFIVTSGGIGPTHDDITYQSIAKAFDLPLKLHQEAFEKMKRLSRPGRTQQPNFSWDVDSPELRAKLRMVKLPTDEARPLSEQFVFSQEDLWVPVSIVNGNVHILPGIPRLFEKLLDGLKPSVMERLVDPEGKGTFRVIISTPLPESSVAGYLTELAARVEPKGVKVGSYPHWERSRNTVTLVGKDQEFLESLVQEVEQNVEGNRVYKSEGEDYNEEPKSSTA